MFFNSLFSVLVQNRSQSPKFNINFKHFLIKIIVLLALVEVS